MDDRLDLEFAYTSYSDSCRDVYGVDHAGSIIECRRPRGHKEDHAAGFGRNRIEWEQ